MATILIVEDDPVLCEMLTFLLEWEGYQIVTAAHGAEGLAQLQQQPVDLILSDVQMPHLDGMQLYLHLRADPTYQTLPFILMSAAPLHPPTIGDPRAIFLEKPLAPATLVNTIAQMMRPAALGTGARVD